MVKVPPHYFSSRHDRDFLPGSPWLVRWGATIAKNIAGVLLIQQGVQAQLNRDFENAVMQAIVD